MARRRSFMATRMSKIRGVDPAEKILLTSIGEIVDTAINNRTPTNPTGRIQKLHRGDPRLPTVANIVADTGVRSVKLSWDPIDGTILENYAIRLTNLDTGETVDKVSYTSSLVFKGESGNYKAEIKAVGRNGVASPVKTIVFVIADSVMILEGAKNGNSTQSNFVSEVALTPRDYTAFCWASFVLNNFSSPVQNSSPIVKLLYGDDLSTATVIQSITMFPESETVTNLNDLDYNFIFRPVGGGVRSGNFETAYSVMFAPFDIPESIADRATRFWVNVTNRDAEADVVSCSIVVWVGSGGRGDLSETPVATVNPRSIDLDGSLEQMAGSLDRTSAELEDAFSVAFWIKPFDLDNASDVEVLCILYPPIGLIENRFDFIYSISSFPTDTNLVFTVYNKNGVSTSFQVSGAFSELFPSGINNWHFITGTFNRSLAGAARLNLYINGVLYTTTGSLVVTNDAASAGDIDRDLTTALVDYNLRVGGFLNASQRVQCRYNSLGLWNSMLSAAEVFELYNGGAGANVDWRTNIGNYTSSSTLLHYYLFGFDTTDDFTICDDYGNSSFIFNLNDSTAGALQITAADDVVTDAPV